MHRSRKCRNQGLGSAHTTPHSLLKISLIPNPTQRLRTPHYRKQQQHSPRTPTLSHSFPLAAPLVTFAPRQFSTRTNEQISPPLVEEQPKKSKKSSTSTKPTNTQESKTQKEPPVKKKKSAQSSTKMDLVSGTPKADTSESIFLDSQQFSILRSSAATTSTPLSVATHIVQETAAKKRASKKQKNENDGNYDDDDYHSDLFHHMDPRKKNEMSRGSRHLGKKEFHMSKFDPQGLGISNEFCPREDATRDGVLIDIVKRKQFQQINHADTVALELTRKEFIRRAEFVADDSLTTVLEPLVTAEDLALLSISPDKLAKNRQFDLTRGSVYSEHIRHLFPVDDFTGGIPPLTDAEIRAMFNRRPRFLNFVTDNNPHGFDVTVLHRLASQTNPIRRAQLIKQQISHRYWHLQTPKAPKNQPKISHRMHVHRTLNPRSNTFKHHYLKPRQQKTKQQVQAENLLKDPLSIHLGSRYMSSPSSTILADIDKSFYNDVKWSQNDIFDKLRKSGLTPDQIEQTRRFALTQGEGFLVALAETISHDQLDPTLQRFWDIRKKTHGKEDLDARKGRLAHVFDGFLANLDNPGRFAKVLISAERDSGQSLVKDSEFRQELQAEVERMGGTSDLKRVEPMEKILNSAMADHINAEAKQKQRAIAATKHAMKKKAEKPQPNTIEPS